VFSSRRNMHGEYPTEMLAGRGRGVRTKNM
jgi:hypothetical protein